MENNRTTEVSNEPEGLFSINLFKKILRKWYLFIPIGILGAVCGFLFSKLSLQEYAIHSTLLVKADNKNSQLANLFQGIGPVKNANLQNQVGILKSYHINFQTLKNLKWNKSWYDESGFRKLDLYNQEPLEVKTDSFRTQTNGVPILITIVSEKSYRIEIDEEIEKNGQEVSIEVDQEVPFGQPFRNEHFGFVIFKIEGKELQVGNEFTLVFNDLSNMALDYSRQLEVMLSDEESEIIHAELKSKYPLRAIDYLNELGIVYMKFGLDEKNRIANNTVKFIDAQLINLTDALKNAGDDFTTFRSKNRIVDMSLEAAGILEEMQAIQREELVYSMRIEYYRNLLNYISDADALKNMIAPSVVEITDQSLIGTIVELNNLYSEREHLSHYVQENNTLFISKNKQIMHVQEILKEKFSNLLNNTESAKNNLNNRKQVVSSKLARLPKTEQDLVTFKRDFDINNNLYTFLLQKRAEAGITKASNDTDAQVLDPADMVTAQELGPNKIINIILGFIIGLGLPVLLFILEYKFNSKLESISDVTRQLDLSVAGAILFNKFPTELPVTTYPKSAITESFRGLRINLNHLLNGKTNNVVAVHSSVPEEGKSFVSVNLASIFAMGNHKVLLIDADMRKSRIHQILKVNNGKGLSNFLENNTGFEKIISTTEIKGLDLITAGPSPDYPSELLGNGRLNILIQEAKKQYDFIIIDNAPAKMVNDGITVGKIADVNLFILKLKKSTRDELEFVNKTAREAVIGNMVVAVNNVEMDIKEYGNAVSGYYNDDTIATRVDMPSV